jgi:exodeoxyribonuclease-1
MGAENAYQAPVLSIGKSVPYSNQTLWLRLDQPELQKTTSDTVDDTTWVIRKRIGEPPFILPPHDRYQQRLSESSRKLAEDNLAWLSSHPDLLRDIIHYHQQFRYPDIPDLDPDAVLYQMGFLSREEESQCRRFHKAPLHDKPRLAGEFSKSEIRTLARRILLRNYPDAIAETDKSDWLRYMNHVNPQKSEDALLDYRGEKRTTPLGALTEIDQIKQEENVDAEQRGLLEGLERHLKTNFNISTTESL